MKFTSLGILAAVLAMGFMRPVEIQSGAADSLAPLLPSDHEIEVARSAGPAAVANAATIYVLRRGTGFVVAQKGGNGFACLVERSRPDSFEPECFDAEGSETILPPILDAAKLREQGAREDAVSKAQADGFASGKYRAPRRAGVTYMLSRENRVFTGEKVISYPPHVMFFAPYLKNSEIGADMKDPNLPWVLNEGSPHAYMIMVVRDAAVEGGEHKY